MGKGQKLNKKNNIKNENITEISQQRKRLIAKSYISRRVLMGIALSLGVTWLALCIVSVCGGGATIRVLGGCSILSCVAVSGINGLLQKRYLNKINRLSRKIAEKKVDMLSNEPYQNLEVVTSYQSENSMQDSCLDQNVSKERIEGIEDIQVVEEDDTLAER